jgi:hypothetical protein
MTMFTLNIKSGDAAMADSAEGARSEIHRLLTRVASQVLDGNDSGHLHDINGNRCGSWWADYPEPEADEDDE